MWHLVSLQEVVTFIGRSEYLWGVQPELPGCLFPHLLPPVLDSTPPGLLLGYALSFILSLTIISNIVLLCLQKHLSFIT